MIPFPEFRDRLVSRLVAAAPDVHELPIVSDSQVAQLAVYLNLLQRWNRRINLTALPLEPLDDRTLDRLFVEPLYAGPYLDGACEWADLGSGGGSPALPLRIICPSVALTMVETRSRKAAFLREAARVLELAAVEVVNARAEAMGGSFDGRFDAISVRAVRIDAAFNDTIRILLKPDGRLIAFQSAEEPGSSPEAFAPVADLRLQTGTRISLSRPANVPRGTSRL